MNMNTYQPFSWATRANISVFHDYNMGQKTSKRLRFLLIIFSVKSALSVAGFDVY